MPHVYTQIHESGNIPNPHIYTNTCTHVDMLPHTHSHNTGTARMPCSSAGSQSLMASQTHCLLQIQLSSTERQREREMEMERKNTGISLEDGMQEKEVDKKESTI